MTHYKPNDRVRVIGNTVGHDYEENTVCTVVSIDARVSTLRARKPDGSVGNNLSFDDVKLVPTIGWDLLKTWLPPEYVAQLAAVEGHQHVALKPEIQDKVLMALPRAQALERLQFHAQALLDEEAEKDGN